MQHRNSASIFVLTFVTATVSLFPSPTAAHTSTQQTPDTAALAKRIFLRNAKNLQSLHSISGSINGTRVGYSGLTSTAEFQLQKPMSFRFVESYKDQDGAFVIELYSDGKTMSNYLVDEQKYFTRKVTDNPKDLPSVCGMAAFFGYSILDTLPYFIKSTNFRMTKFRGKYCAAMQVHFESFGHGDNDSMCFYIDTKTALLLGWDTDFGFPKSTFVYTDLKLNPMLDPKIFSWTPPAGVKRKL